MFLHWGFFLKILVQKKSIYLGMSISKSQAKFLSSGILSKLGTSKQDVPDDKYPVVEEIMKSFGAEFITRAQKNITDKKMIASGKMLDIEMEYTQEGKKFILQVGYPSNNPASKYFDFLNKGVIGTKNVNADGNSPYRYNPAKRSLPRLVIEKWLEFNKLKQLHVKKYTKKGVEDKLVTDKKELAEILAYSIHRKGIKSSHFFDKAVDSTFGKQFKEALTEAIGQDITIHIVQINKELKNDTGKKPT